jgi:hypothetical protein
MTVTCRPASASPWWSTPAAELYVGDTRAVLVGMPEASMDCIVTSPPHFGLPCYDSEGWHTATVDGSLDRFTTVRMDRCPHPARPATTGPSGCATEPAPQPGREPERTTDPCPPQPRTTPVSARPDDAGGPFDHRHVAGSPTGSSDLAGHR